MAIYLSNRDGGKTDEQGHYKFQTNAFTGNVLDGGLLVTQNSPLGMSVKVSGGDARIPYSDYAYTAWIPAGSPETVTVTTANPSNPRIDRLVMYVDRGATPSSVTANNPTLCKLMLVAGTPAGSPSRPSNGTVDTAVSNNPYIDLADIRVNAGVTQITNADITDTRVLVGAPIADGSVTSTKLSTSAIYQNEVLRTSNFTSTSTSLVLVTGMSLTVTVPVGGRKLLVMASGSNIYYTGGVTAYNTVSLVKGVIGSGGVVIGRSQFNGANTSGQAPFTIIAIDTPAAGSQTYQLGVHTSNASAGVGLEASATFPIRIVALLV